MNIFETLLLTAGTIVGGAGIAALIRAKRMVRQTQ